MTDSNMLLVLLSGAVVLDYLLGVDLIIALSKKIDVAIRLSIATLACAVVTVLLAHGAEFALVAADIEWLRIPLMVQVTLVSVALTGLAVRFVQPRLYVALRNYFPIIVCNSLLLGIALLTDLSRGIAASIVHALALGGGFCILLLVFAYAQQRLTTSSIPAPFRGAPISLISLGILSLGFVGFKG